MMSRLVSIKRYSESEQGRIMEQDLIPGETYTAMFTLSSIRNYAVLSNVRLERMNPEKTLLGFRTLDQDLIPQGDTSYHNISDGYVDAKRPDERFHRVGSMTGTIVFWDIGIFREYEGEIEIPTLQETVDLSSKLVLSNG